MAIFFQFVKSITRPISGTHPVRCCALQGSAEDLRVVKLKCDNSTQLNYNLETNPCHNIGVNGTFFYSDSAYLPAGYSLNDVYRISINNGARALAHGEQNRKSQVENGPCGTFVVLNRTMPSGRAYFVDDIVSFPHVIGGETINMSDVKFAVGGTNLYLDQDLTWEQYKNLIRDTQDPTVANGNVNRTALFYVGGNVGQNVILLTLFGSNGSRPYGSVENGGATLFELRDIIKDQYPTASFGIALDGGTSTQIAYKMVNDPEVYTIISTDAAGDARNIPSMITFDEGGSQ